MSLKKNSRYFHWNDKLDQLIVKCMRTLVDEPKGKFIAGAYLVLEQMLKHDSPSVLHPHCAKTNRVPFPCYDALAYVFGKNGDITNVKTDQTGHPSNTPERTKVPSPSVNAGNSKATSRRNRAFSIIGFGSVASLRFSNFWRNRARRSNIETPSDVTELKPMIEDAARSLRSMVRESDEDHKQRSMVLPELEMIEGLTEDQVYDEAIQLGNDDGMLELFFNIATNQGRKRFIERLLL
ncbi:hypothetical protein LINPERHAP2_LOCUS26058 [Linum perenne]